MLATDGDADAQCAMGDYYACEGKNFNPAQLNYWYEKAAIQGNPKAQGFLAGAYINAMGVNRDLEKAEYWAQKASAQNSPAGMVILSQCFLMKDDYPNTIHWLKKAKELGFPDPDKLLEMVTLLHQTQTQSKERGFSEGAIELPITPSMNKIQERVQRVDEKKLDIFRNYVRERTHEIYNNKRVLRGLVSDVFAGNERLINSLKIAIDGKVSIELVKLKQLESTQQDTGIRRAFSVFVEWHGIEKSRAVEVFYVLLRGLDMDARILDNL